MRSRAVCLSMFELRGAGEPMILAVERGTDEAQNTASLYSQVIQPRQDVYGDTQDAVRVRHHHHPAAAAAAPLGPAPEPALLHGVHQRPPVTKLLDDVQLPPLHAARVRLRGRRRSEQRGIK